MRHQGVLLLSLAFLYRVAISFQKYSEARVTKLLETRHYTSLEVPEVSLCGQPIWNYDDFYFEYSDQGETMWEWQRRFADGLDMAKMVTMEVVQFAKETKDKRY